MKLLRFRVSGPSRPRCRDATRRLGTTALPSTAMDDMAQKDTHQDTPHQMLSNRLIAKEKFVSAAAAIVWVPPASARGTDATPAQLATLQAKLGYTFEEPSLLYLALIHRSAAAPHNQSLAWMGDAVLYLIASEQLAAAIGYASGKALSDMRRLLVSRDHCAQCSERLGLKELLVVGKARLSTEEPIQSSMEAEAFEAILGAMYVDGGIGPVMKAYDTMFPLDEAALERLQGQLREGEGGAPT